MTPHEIDEYADKIVEALEKLIESRIQVGSSEYSDITARYAEVLAARISDLMHQFHIEISRE